MLKICRNNQSYLYSDTVIGLHACVLYLNSVRDSLSALLVIFFVGFHSNPFFCSDDPIIEYQYFTYDGPYVTSKIRRNGAFEFEQVENCTEQPNSRNVIMNVKCPTVCGQRFPHKNHQTDRISGGKEAAEGSHPWLVSLHINGSFVCAGSIIDRYWVKITFTSV